ncbi:hypothetical protein [Staphylococcus sp. Marseille-Q6910]|uniref:hypothetical protein n=1 Tax=Staphylococcus sp. Marseille-Q6910 TaxID=2937990 RepID=UPI00203DB4C7|nr:hypothetical protein [Staphylococcus sp. Marseille-Q6910]
MAGKTMKNIDDVQNKIETTLEKINLDKIDHGDITMDNETNEFILDSENKIEEITLYLQEFIDRLNNSKDKIKKEKINEKLIDRLKDGGPNAEMIAKIFNT